MSGFLVKYALYFAWLTSLVATGGSLYFSEIRHFVPCQLCWYQRILMYPLVILLGMASYRNDRHLASYILPLSTLGSLLALLHYLEQKVPNFGVDALCQVGVPCSGQYINLWGFVTIPFLSLVAFVLITALMVLTANGSRRVTP